MHRPFRCSPSSSRSPANTLFATGAGCTEHAQNDALSEAELLAGGATVAIGRGVLFEQLIEYVAFS